MPELPTGVVTFLLTDIEGSAALWDADARVMASSLERHDALLLESVVANGGALLKSKGEGDSTFSVFARATDAAAAAVAAQAAIHAEEWPTFTPLQVRMVLHTGEAVERDGDYFGPAVNRAARLRATAVGGQVVVSATTAGLVADHLPHGVGLVDLGQRDLKDLARPEHVFELSAIEADDAGGAGGIPLPGPLLTTRDTVPVVGRAAELERVQRRWERAAAGECQVVLVAGEPGIGKTRLVREFANRAHAQGVTVLFGRCDEDPAGPFQPFAEALSTYIGSCPRASLQHQAGPLAGELARLVPDIGDRLRAIEPPLAADPETERHRLFEAVSDMVERMTKAAPVVLVLDDLHWAARPTLALLRHLLRTSAALRLMVVATYRDTELGRTHPLADVLADLRRDADVERIALVGLDESAVADFAAAAAGHSLDEDLIRLARAVHSETEGNPFFVGQVLRHLDESGGVTHTDGRWVTGGARLGIPEGVREVIGRRLARLSDIANRVLAVAAVVGAEFDLQLVSAVDDGRDTDVLDALDEAAGASIVAEVTGAFGRYAFGHALVRQTLLAELSATRRVVLHRRVAEALEKLGGAPASALAHHWLEAAVTGELAVAVGHARAAAHEAASQTAYEQAAAWYERAAQAVELLAPADVSTRTDLLIAASRAARLVGAFDRARKVADAAVVLSEDIDDGALRATAVLAYSEAAVEFGEMDSLIVSRCEGALAVLPATGHDRLRAQLLMMLAGQIIWGGHLERAMALYSEGTELAERAGDVTTVVFGLIGKLRCDARPTDADDVAHLLAAVNAMDPLQLAGAGSMVSLYLMYHLAQLGDGDALAAETRRMIAVLQGVPIAAAQWGAAHIDAIRAARTDPLPVAIACNDASAALASKMDSPDIQGGVTVQRLYLMIEEDRLAEAEAIIRMFLDAYASVVSFRAELLPLLVYENKVDDICVEVERLGGWDASGVPSDALRPLAIVRFASACALAGDGAAAQALYDELLPWSGLVAPVISATEVVGPFDRYLGLLAMQLGRFDEAVDRLERAIVQCDRLGTRRVRAWCERDLANVLAAHGDTTRAADVRASAATTADEYGLLLLARLLAEDAAGN